MSLAHPKSEEDRCHIWTGLLSRFDQLKVQDPNHDFTDSLDMLANHVKMFLREVEGKFCTIIC